MPHTERSAKERRSAQIIQAILNDSLFMAGVFEGWQQMQAGQVISLEEMDRRCDQTPKESA